MLGLRLEIEHDDAPLREGLAQMVVSATMAEAELDDGAVEPPDALAHMGDDGALRLHAADEAVETAHAKCAQRPDDEATTLRARDMFRRATAGRDGPPRSKA